MTRVWLFCAVFSGLLLFVPLLIIRAQPYHDPDLEAFLMTDDCSGPCFMGIEPGVMTTGEVLGVLNTHPWIETIDSHIVTPSQTAEDSAGIIHWTWSGKQPDWIDPSEKGMVRIT